MLLMVPSRGADAMAGAMAASHTLSCNGMPNVVDVTKEGSPHSRFEHVWRPVAIAPWCCPSRPLADA